MTAAKQPVWDVVALGEGVAGFAIGDRVAWVYAPGSYAEQVEVPEDALVPVPDAIDDRTAAAHVLSVHGPYAARGTSE